MENFNNDALIDLLSGVNKTYNSKEVHDYNYYSKYIGLSVHSSGFYGKQVGNKVIPLELTDFVFNSKEDIVLIVEGKVTLKQAPVNNGIGNLYIKGYGFLVVNDSITYDGRLSTNGDVTKSYVDLNDALTLQAAKDYTDANMGVVGVLPYEDDTYNAGWITGDILEGVVDTMFLLQNGNASQSLIITPPSTSSIDGAIFGVKDGSSGTNISGNAVLSGFYGVSGDLQFMEPGETIIFRCFNNIWSVLTRYNKSYSTKKNLSELNDVSFTTLGNKHIPYYDTNVNLWTNLPISGVLGYTPESTSNKVTDLNSPNDEDYPTTNTVKTYVDNAVVGLLNDRGSYNPVSGQYPTTGGSGVGGVPKKGDIWYISANGTINGISVTAGSSVRAIANSPGQTDANWDILDVGLGYVPENLANKITSILGNETNVDRYTSAKAVVDYVASISTIPTVQNGLKIEDNAIKLGGELTDDNTRLTVNSPNKNFFIGAPVNGQDLGFISLSSTVLNINNAVDHDTVQGNTLYITPGGLNSINQFQSGVQTVLNANPEAVVMRYGDNKLINLYIFGGGLIPGSGETLTINDITFTEGIDFIGEGNYVFDTTYILNTLNWNSIPNFVSVTEKTDSFNEPYLEVIFSEIAVVTTTISNLSISNFANENKMLVDKDGVLLRSRNNEITLTNDITSINAKNCNIVQNNEEGVIKNTLYLNAFGSFLSNRDATDSSISSSSISGGFGSNISNFNNKKIGLQISGEILSGESFTVNGITFTEGVDFTTVNDPNLDALAIANIDYSSVPNFVSVSSLNDVITFIFSTIDNTIVSNITNSDVANYLFTTSVFAGKDFALMQSNNSGLQIGDTGHIFSDNTIEKQGIRYAGDYSATYTDRSLIDKAYADSLNTNALDKDTVKLAENINKGQAVYVSGANGTNIIVSKASNTSEATSSKTFGLLETSGVTNDIVNVVTRGLLTGLDTSAATVGDAVWLGTNGDLLYGLANKPYAPAHLVFIGVVTRHHAVNGEIFVNVQNGFELNEIHNVSITTPTDNQALIYESASGLWKNKDITTVGTIASGVWQGTPIADAYIASAATWNGKFNTPTGLTANRLPYWNGSTFVNSNFFVNSNESFVQGSGFYMRNTSGTNIISFGVGTSALVDITSQLQLRVSNTGVIIADATNFGILRNLQMYNNTGGYMSQLYNGTGATSAWFSKSVRIGDGTGTPTVANALTCLDLASTTLGLGLNLIAGDLGTTRNGLIWYNTVSNTFKGIANATVRTLAFAGDTYKFDELLQLTDCNAIYTTGNTGIYMAFVPKGDITVTKIYYNLQSAGTDTVRVAIYADGTNTPTTLIVQGNEAITGATTTGHRSVTISSTNLTAGIRYWIAIKNDNGACSFLSRNNVYSNNITRESFTSGVFVASPAPSSSTNAIWLGLGV